jgi:hypothetical protein
MRDKAGVSGLWELTQERGMFSVCTYMLLWSAVFDTTFSGDIRSATGFETSLICPWSTEGDCAR